MVPKELFADKNEVDLSIELINGSRIELKGGDRYDTLRGNSLSNVILDEAAYIPPDCWEMVIRPALADQRGNAIFISTPCGFNHFHAWYEQAETEPDWETFSYNTIEGGNVPEEEVELARRTLDERTFKQEFLASFETFRAESSRNSTIPTLTTMLRIPVVLCWWAWISMSESWPE